MRVKYSFTVLALCSVFAVPASAQVVPEVKLPASPAGQAAVQLGGQWQKTDDGNGRYTDGKWIVVDYSRPLLRGRKNIFGSGADYGQTVSDGAPVWRAGANATTRLTAQAPLTIGGKRIDAGVYNIFVELKQGNWTLILNTQPVQEKYDPNDKVKLFGAYNYNPSFDVLRVPMTVRSSQASVEQFTIGFLDVSQTSGTLAMWWENTLASLEFRLAEPKP